MHLLHSDDLSTGQINEIFKIADQIIEGKKFSLKPGSTCALLFEKASTRTRLSFEVAMAHLGGNAIYIDLKTTQLSRGEPISDTAKIISSYCNFIAARLYKQADLEEIAKHSSVPVINALTDKEHPTQALADCYTIKQKKGSLKGLKIAFVGDIQSNTAYSLMVTATKLGAEIVLIGPKSCVPDKSFVSKAQKYGKVTVTDDAEKGMRDIDVIYTDTFVSMGQEAEADARRKLFMPYQVTQKMVKAAKPDAIVMHCLPAHRGEEIAANVLDGPKSVIWQQAYNKMLLNQALLVFLSKNH